jgi:hypothetical protein
VQGSIPAPDEEAAPRWWAPPAYPSPACTSGAGALLSWEDPALTAWVCVALLLLLLLIPLLPWLPIMQVLGAPLA